MTPTEKALRRRIAALRKGLGAAGRALSWWTAGNLITRTLAADDRRARRMREGQ